MTKHPKIYNQTHWGCIKIDNNANKIENFEEIFENRNKFIDEYDIKKLHNKSTRYISRYLTFLNKNYKNLDHLEVYLLKDGKYLILNSPYCKDDYIIEGWNKIYQLYANGSQSFIKIVDKKEMHESTKKTNKENLVKFYEKFNENPEDKYKICSECNQKYLYSNKTKHKQSKKHKNIVRDQKIHKIKESYDLSTEEHLKVMKILNELK